MVFSNNLLMGAAGQATGYEIEQSIRFDNVDGVNAGGAQMYRLALTGTPTNDKKATISAWVKRATLGFNQVIAYSGDPNGSTSETFRFNTNNTLTFAQASSVYNLTTTQVFRDVGAWYHIVAEIDTANGTSADRANLYVNGVKVTSFSTATYPSLNYVTNWTASSGSIAHTWGSNAIPAAGPSSQLQAGYMADMYMLDGEKAGPTAFGEFNDSGVWIPTAYSGAFGNNGYHMTGETASALGDDFSGNGLDFTTVALATTDQMLDTPTLNFSTFNPLNVDVYTLSDGNLNTGTGGDAGAVSTFAIDVTDSDGFYFEVSSSTAATYPDIGLQDADDLALAGATTISSYNTGRYTYQGNSGNFNDEGSSASYGTTYTTNTIGVLVQSGNLYFSKDGTIQNSGTAAKTGLTGMMYARVSYSAGSGTQANFTANFGQSAFAHDPGSTYKAWNTANLATPSITDGSAYFQPVIYTTQITAQDITFSGNSDLAPDWLWFKRRDNASNHFLFDKIRGALQTISSDDDTAEVTSTGSMTAFGTDGFSLGDGGSNNDINGTSGATFIAWGWKANGAGSSNEDGATTSTVSASATSGFSIVKWTGTGANTTLGHGLGVAPQMILVKNLADADSWVVYHEDVGATKGLTLDTTATPYTASTFFNNTAPTSSVFSIGAGGRSNGSSDAMIAYCFAEIPGYSSIGSYTGNGSASGPFVSTGMKPAYVLIKRTNATENWLIMDSTRYPNNPANNPIFANTYNADANGGRPTDFLSNGFKPRNTLAEMNASGSTYIYMAFAEHPFGGDGVAPATAR